MSCNPQRVIDLNVPKANIDYPMNLHVASDMLTCAIMCPSLGIEVHFHVCTDLVGPVICNWRRRGQELMFVLSSDQLTDPQTAIFIHRGRDFSFD